MSTKSVEHRQRQGSPLEEKRVMDAAGRLCWERLTKTEAEDLLDWLEANRYQRPLLSFVGGKGFSIQTVATEEAIEQPVSVERRASARHRLQLGAASVLVTTADGRHVSGLVRDMSTDGLALHLSIPCEPGTLLSIAWADKVRHCSRTLALRVVRIVAQADATYLLGGTFVDRLGDSELRTLV